jgi:hypothetical protein
MVVEHIVNLDLPQLEQNTSREDYGDGCAQKQSEEQSANSVGQV